MLKPLVVINNLSKKFAKNGAFSLNNINAHVYFGKITGLVGPDGAGKTTLIRSIAGLLQPTSGSITVNGLDNVKQANNIQKIISYMPQKFGLYEDLTVSENLNLYADLKDVTGNEKNNQLERLLEFTALRSFQNQLAGTLSGGMKQKLGLACCLIKKPILLLLDEPSVGVDPISRRELWNIVKELVDDKIGIVWSTSYLDEAEKCDEVILLNQGQSLFQGVPSELCKRVKNRIFQVQGITNSIRKSLAIVLGNDNVIDGTIQGGRLRIVTRQENIYSSLESFGLEGDLTLAKVDPRFEDAFIDILGGGPSGRSFLAENIQRIPIHKDYVIVAKGLKKVFKHFTAVNNVSFSIHQGEIFGLLGPNGAGKSTTFKMMCGLLSPTSGTSAIMGYDCLTSSKAARSNIGYMAQKFSLYESLSVLQNLNFFAGIYGLCGKSKKDEIGKMIQIFGLKQYLNQSADSLPYGFKQRLALACAIMHNPSVLFLDEPTSGVDPITRREFWTHINGIVQKGITVVITTHFMDEAEYCDKIGLIHQGQLIALGAPDYLKNQVKSETLPDPTLEDAFIALIKQKIIPRQKGL